MKLAKLLYFSDLRAVSAGDDPITGVEWKWLRYGPFSNALLDVEGQLVDDGIITSDEKVYTFRREVRLALLEDVGLRLPEAEEKFVVDVVREMGDLAPSSLKELSYQTPPMLEAQADGRRGDALDLDLVRPAPRVTRTLAHLHEVMRSLPEQFDDDGVEEDTLRELEEWAPFRAEANRLMMGDP
jgi:hypothetical protein